MCVCVCVCVCVCRGGGGEGRRGVSCRVAMIYNDAVYCQSQSIDDSHFHLQADFILKLASNNQSHTLTCKQVSSSQDPRGIDG